MTKIPSKNTIISSNNQIIQNRPYGFPTLKKYIKAPPKKYKKSPQIKQYLKLFVFMPWNKTQKKVCPFKLFTFLISLILQGNV
jgi:hypothetical protein